MLYVFDSNSLRVLGNYYPGRFPTFWKKFEDAVASGMVVSVREGCVVTEEGHKLNAAKIPNVCKHFGVACTNVEGFMDRNDWQF